jgi:putative colanic acid biosynthesis acetyltransferase WcaF
MPEQPAEPDLSPLVEYQRLDRFSVPAGFRGASRGYVQLWWCVQALLKPLPQFLYGLRRWVLRRFGAKVGRGVRIRPGVEITYPWKVSLGDYCWIGDDVTLYSLGPIAIGPQTVVSQNSYLCAADHDCHDVLFPIRERAIRIGAQVWIASDVWVGPGVTIADGTVVGARSSVLHDLPAGMICVGSPCHPVRPRVMHASAVPAGSPGAEAPLARAGRTPL